MTRENRGGPQSPTGPAAEIVENSLPRHWNACGLAAVASVLARLRVGAWAAETTPDVTSQLDHLIARFPPDVPLGLGTTSFRIAAALRAHGVDAEIAHGGFAARHASVVLERARTVIAGGGIVPVCLDDGWLGGPPFSAHWAVLLAVDDWGVRLGNCRAGQLALPEFIRAWSCPQLPYTHNACAVLARAAGATPKSAFSVATT